MFSLSFWPSTTRLALATVLGVSLAACSEGATAPNVALSVAGEWRGQPVDWRQEGAMRAVRLTLQQNGARVTGTAISSLWTRVAAGIVATVGGRINALGEVELTSRSIEANGCFDLDVRMTRTIRGSLAGGYQVIGVRDGCGLRYAS